MGETVGETGSPATVSRAGSEAPTYPGEGRRITTSAEMGITPTHHFAAAFRPCVTAPRSEGADSEGEAGACALRGVLARARARVS